MIEVEVTREMIDEATVRSRDLGILRDSITYGEGNVAGFIGKIAVANFLEVKLEPTFDHDMILGDTRIAVKTKRTKVTPQPNYNCTVAALNTSQKCDWYVFTRTRYDYGTTWILGYMPVGEFYKTARFIPVDQHDNSNDWDARADCYNLHVSELKSLENVKPVKASHGWW